MREYYDIVMDSDANPLRRLHKPRRFQIMSVLSFMWTVIFCFAFGAWYWFGELMLGHLAVLMGIAVTSVIFRKAEKGEGLLEATARADWPGRPG